MNPKIETVEELRGRRKALHMGMVKLAREDLERQLFQFEAAFQVGPVERLRGVRDCPCRGVVT